MVNRTDPDPIPKTWHTKLSSWGGSQGIRIPKAVCAEIGIAPGDELDIAVKRDESQASIVITGNSKQRSFASAPRISLQALFAEYRGDYRGEELD